MGHSFVSINDRGFWMHDSTLELWLRLLALQIDEPADAETETVHRVTKQIRDQWLLASKGFFSGCVPDALDEAVATPEGRSIVRSAVNVLLGSLSAGPAVITEQMQALLGFHHLSGRYDVTASQLAEVGQAFIDLLDGKITTTAEDGPYLPSGCSRWRAQSSP